jgi:hypothetical protein
MEKRELLAAVDQAIEWPDKPSGDPLDVLRALVLEMDAALVAGALGGTDPRLLLSTFFVAGMEARQMVDRTWVDELRKHVPDVPYEMVARRIVAGARAGGAAIEAAQPQIERIMRGAAIPSTKHVN